MLLNGAEALEFLCADPRHDSNVRLEQVVSATIAYYLAGHYARSFVLLREAVPEDMALPPVLGLLVAVLLGESGGQWSIQGGPVFRADGVIMVPNSLLSIQGNGTLDATNVQFWLHRVEPHVADPATGRPLPGYGLECVGRRRHGRQEPGCGRDWT